MRQIFKAGKVRLCLNLFRHLEKSSALTLQAVSAIICYSVHLEKDHYSKVGFVEPK